MSMYIGPLKPGEFTTNSSAAADIGLTTNIGGADFRMCQVNSVALTNAGGLIVQRAYTAGIPSGKIFADVTAGSLDVAGGVPIATSVNIGFAYLNSPNAITATVTIPASAWLLVQFTGPGQVQANTTLVTPAAFAVSSLSAATSVDTATGLIFGYVGRVTNTAVATVANGAVTCIWSLPA